MIVLGIESSCDETAAAIVNNNKQILSNIIYSQIKEHAITGGVVPEVAARSHLTAMYHCIQEALAVANLSINDIDAFAATSGPGLIGGLLVGINTAQSLALATNKPFIAVHHLEGHLLTSRLLENIKFPFLALLISGGHSQFVAVENINQYKIIGTTLDDAVGEAFDKTARLLGLPYPGGKYIEKQAKLGDPSIFKFNAPLLNTKDANFSFSGLKTSVRNTVDKLILKQGKLDQSNINDIAAAFEHTVIKILSQKMQFAIKQFRQNYKELNHVVVSGGVAANLNIRAALKEIINNENANFFAPPLDLCGDNAAMIAWSGLERLQLGLTDSLNIKPNPNWQLNNL
ncbi:tRNA (adenosine(37)-N6)-threonylcarbamoyltransferase complex transferase subunit TsaD [Rickettsiales bacterium LUAb2]